MRILKLFFFAVLLIVSCKGKEEKKVNIDSQFRTAEHFDSTYNGVVKYYDIKSHHLLFSCSYKNGILEGEKKDFYANGSVYSSQFYVNGKLNGYVSFYDTTGSLFSQQYFYYGIKVGPDIQRHSGEVNEYNFYSFDGKPLLSLNYDSLKTKKITDIQKEYFFFHTNDFSYLDSPASQLKEYFIYLPQPPKFSFQYSLVKIDSAYNVLTTEQEIKNNEIWSAFSVNEKSSSLAIKLFIKDSMNMVNYTMFKRIF